MLKSNAVLTIPGALAGASLYLGAPGEPFGRAPQAEAYVIEIGVAFPEEAIRAALPQSIEPFPKNSGGIAIYAGEDGWALSPLSAGYVWIDGHDANGTPARYLLRSFASEPGPSDELAGAHGEIAVQPRDVDGSGMLHAVVRPDLASSVEIAIKPPVGPCLPGPAPSDGHLLAMGPGGSLGSSSCRSRRAGGGRRLRQPGRT